jgi:hypothetical protein
MWLMMYGFGNNPDVPISSFLPLFFGEKIVWFSSLPSLLFVKCPYNIRNEIWTVLGGSLIFLITSNLFSFNVFEKSMILWFHFFKEPSKEFTVFTK